MEEPQLNRSSGSGSIWMSPEWIAHSQILLNSFCHWTHRELSDRIGSQIEQARTLFFAPFVVVSHGTQADPILNYGNKIALDLWETDIAQFTQTPSRMTAEPAHRDERARLLDRTTRNGFVDDYQGIRISSSGRRFRIDKAIVWNLLGANGERVGQAATFNEWTFII